MKLEGPGVEQALDALSDRHAAGGVLALHPLGATHPAGELLPAAKLGDLRLPAGFVTALLHGGRTYRELTRSSGAKSSWRTRPLPSP